MNKNNLIDIQIGDRGFIDGKIYEAKGADYFGTKGCLTCDLHEPGYGCTNGKVVCYNPPRVFKQVSEYCVYDYDDNHDFEYMKWNEALLLILILAIPMSACWIWSMISKFWILIISKIKNDSNK
jgi:hypothetical protein